MIELSGAIALICTFSAFFFDNKRVILLIQGASLISFGIHFWLLGAVASALFLMIQVGRNLFFALSAKRLYEHIFLVSLIGLFIYIYYLNRLGDPLSWLSLVGSIIGSIAFWMKKLQTLD